MTNEELQAKMRHFNALLRDFGKRRTVFTELNAEMPEDSRVEIKLLLEEIETELARRTNETQEQTRA